MKMPRILLVSFLALLLSVTLSCARLLALQDKGGISLLVAVNSDKGQIDQAVQQTMAVMQSRCDHLRIFCKLERQGGDKANQIMLHVSSPMEPARVKGILLAEGLEIRAVVSRSSPAPVMMYPTQAEAAAAAGTQKEVFPYQYEGEESQVRYLITEHEPIITGMDVRNAAAFPNKEKSSYSIAFTLKPDGAVRLGDWTRSNINSYMAVILNKQVRTVAYIKSEISDSGEISGRFTKQQAEDIASVLSTGNLPASVALLSEGTYKP